MGTVILKSIQKSYDGNVACTGIDFTINEGEFFTFLGPSGCGKTTILRLIAGFIKPENGRIFIGDKDITEVPAEKREIGMVFQNYALFPFMTVYENVEYGLKIRKLPKVEIEKKVKKYLTMVRLDGYGNRNVSELSGGEQQRVALARSLAIEPKVLLLDEPLSNLDARLRDNMRVEIKEIIEKLGITTIFVTHDQIEALTMSDRIAVFDNGKCIQIGTPKEIYSNPYNSFVARFIGDTNLLKAEISNKEARISDDIVFTLQKESVGEYISIRPQDITLIKENTSKVNVLNGVLEDIQLSGFLVVYAVRIKNTVFKVTVLNTSTNNREVSVGDEVFLHFDPKAIKILEK